MTRSLRTRLVLGTTTAMAVVLLAAGAMIYLLVRDRLLGQFDSALADKARLLASVVEVESGKIDLEFEDLDMGEFRRPQGPGYLQLWFESGSVLYRSGSLGRDSLPRTAATTESSAFRWVTLPDGHSARAVEMRFLPRLDEDEEAQSRPGNEPRSKGAAGLDRQSLVLVLARTTTPVDSALGSLAAALAAVGVVAVGASLGVLWLVVRRSLRPLDCVAEQIHRLGEESLAERIPADGVPRELRPVVTRLNGLLGRLEAAFRRERGFSADVAHELRTPLAGLRTTLDVALSRPRQPGQYAEAMADCQEIVAQIQQMVENLLMLARLETGQVEMDSEPVFPERLAQAEWKPLNATARKRHLRVLWEKGHESPVMTDPTLLGLVVRNLLANAVAYADEGGSVTIETDSQDGAARIRVANSGSKVAREQAPRVFDRFWRADDARTDAGVHCGLGLSLVKRAVSALGGSVEVRSSRGGLFEVTVALPRRTET